MGFLEKMFPQKEEKNKEQENCPVCGSELVPAGPQQEGSHFNPHKCTGEKEHSVYQ